MVGAYRPKATAPGAIPSLVLGILSLFICGIIFGALAIHYGLKAMRTVDSMPQSYDGKGLAIAGTVLGAVGVLSALAIIGFVFISR
jgi:hypothetical protein